MLFVKMNFSPKKSKETIAAAVNEAKQKAVAKLEDLDTSLSLAVSRARNHAAATLDDLDVKLTEMSTQRDETYDVHGVPPHFKEHYIISGYRSPKASFAQSLLYCFGLNNEMINFWTHFLPFWYFLWRIVSLSMTVDFIGDRYTWPLLSFMITCLVYPITSSIAHAFSSMSSRARHVCFFFDYAGIATYSFGAAIGYQAYSFPSILRDTWFSDCFVPVAMMNGIICTILSCESRFIEFHKLCKVFRVTAFSLPYVWDSIPLVFRFCANVIFEPEALCSSANSAHTRQFLLATITALLYAAHFPERFAPGRFDIIGHSHQLFHICGIIATNEQMNGILADFHQNRSLGLEKKNPAAFGWSLGAVIIVVAFCTFVVAIDAWRVSQYDEETLDKLMMHLHHCNNSLLMHIPTHGETLYRLAQQKCETIRQRFRSRSGTPVVKIPVVDCFAALPDVVAEKCDAAEKPTAEEDNEEEKTLMVVLTKEGPAGEESAPGRAEEEEEEEDAETTLEPVDLSAGIGDTLVASLTAVETRARSIDDPMDPEDDGSVVRNRIGFAN